MRLVYTVPRRQVSNKDQHLYVNLAAAIIWQSRNYSPSRMSSVRACFALRPNSSNAHSEPVEKHLMSE